MFKPPTRATLLAVAIVASACEPPDPGGSAAEGPRGVTIRDSAGIAIVENHTPEHPAGDFWTLDPVPELVLGGEETLTGGANHSIQLVWGVERVEGYRIRRGPTNRRVPRWSADATRARTARARADSLRPGRPSRPSRRRPNRL